MGGVISMNGLRRLYARFLGGHKSERVTVVVGFCFFPYRLTGKHGSRTRTFWCNTLVENQVGPLSKN